MVANFTYFTYIGMSVRQWPGRLGINPRSSHTKDSKNVASLHNTQNYTVGNKDKVEQSRERSSAFPYILV